MKSFFYQIIILLACYNGLMAGGAPSTYFNIYVPPNNDAVKRNVALIVTAIYDDTEFTITDDDADGDNDDTVTGVLSAGQSYILYIKDNGVNDDALYASGGVLKRDGDYFIINSSKLVFASMSTDSDWQHDFVPSVNKTSLGEKFIIYAPKISSSNRDLNVFAFTDNTTVTISKISFQPTTQTGYTNIDYNTKTIIKQRTINVGEDLIHFFTDGRDVMITGETYMIETNKPASVQYGALWGNAKDGGGYVPSSNGSSSGEKFYFAVPYQVVGEQEIRAVSWDDDNEVLLERYDNGTWVTMSTWSLDRLKPADWVGKRNGNVAYPTVFRVTCTPGKKVSVFEANWMETGNPGTSDMASMLSSQYGTDTGKEFLAYLLPPGKQTNVVNPFTGQFFGGNFAHCYLFAGNQATTVTIKDAKTNGGVINRTYSIAANRYADAFFSLEEWKSIYNGDGNPDSGPDRPYVLIESDENIAVMNANTNDNWMLYFGSSLPSSFTQVGTMSQSTAIPGDSITYVSVIDNGPAALMNPELVVTVGSGGIPHNSYITVGATTIEGVINITETGTTITFSGIPNLNPGQQATVTTEFVINPTFNNGDPIPVNTIISVESSVTGTSEGQIQQSIVSSGVQDISTDLSNLFYNNCLTGGMVTLLTDSWNSAWIDYDNDGWEDLFIADRDPNAPNQLYKNNGNGSFTRYTSGPLVNTSEKTIASAWGDYNNDGFIDVFVVNATGTKSRLYKNVNGTFTEQPNAGFDINPEYFHAAAWFDMDNDGYLDLIITNYFETKFHELYRNNKNGTFTRIYDSPITLISSRSTMPALADYNNDGLVDVFIPNGDNEPNSLFTNLGNGIFEPVTTGAIVTDATNSVGAAWGDYDNDGWMDLVVLNASEQDNILYHNEGDGTFTTINSIISNDEGNSHSAAWMDVNNDGYLDLLVTNDVGLKYFYMNNGDGTFVKKYDEIFSADFGYAMGIATADYNKDGSLDAYVSTHTNDNNEMFCNQSIDNNNFINIKLVGTNSNASGIGATIRVKVNGEWQMRQVLPVQGLGSQSSMRQHFGLGDATIIESIEVSWPSGYIQTISNVAANQFITLTEEDANLMNGFAFDDANDNCVWDEGELKIESVKFNIDPIDTRFTTLANGAYELRLGADSYNISLVPNDYWSMTCPTNMNITASNGTYSMNLPLNAIQNGYDLDVTTGVAAWRRGFPNESILSSNNFGTMDAYDVVIALTYPAEIDLKSASIPWDEQIGNTFYWYIDTLAAGDNINIQLKDSVTLVSQVGQSYPISSTISAAGSDLKLSNNTFAESIEVVGAIDPNDILVTPKGEGREGFIDRDQVLTYTIRFQNVGSYYASRIVLKNQLSEYLDYTTFDIESVSHEGYTFSVNHEGMLTVKFDNINLPDSTMNEPGSHGFFKYTIKAKSDVSGGSRIENSVLIGFDYEDPLMSNIVVNTIKYSGSQSAHDLVVFPNPVHEEINIVGESFEINTTSIPLLTTVRIMNAEGRVAAEYSNTSDLLLNKNIEHFSPGLYFIIASDGKGNLYQGKFIKM